MTVALIKDDEGLFEPIHAADLPIEKQLSKIQSSPYSEEDHLLNLNTLDLPYQQLAIALRALEPIDMVTYAISDYTTTFNFEQIMSVLRKINPQFPGLEDVYIVAFKSAVWDETRESSEKRRVLADVDKASHAEANLSGGLLKYWFGTPNEHGQNLATCYWRARKDAKLGGGGPAHRQGMAKVRGWFKEWRIEEYLLTISPGAVSYDLRKPNK